MDWKLNFISEENFTEHVRATIEKYGENLYNLTAGGNIIASDAEIEQGALETSNVNVVNEMVNMITIQRAYEAGQKVITSIDETLDKAVNNAGRV